MGCGILDDYIYTYILRVIACDNEHITKEGLWLEGQVFQKSRDYENGGNGRRWQNHRALTPAKLATNLLLQARMQKQEILGEGADTATEGERLINKKK